jgi:hypothetical protein
MMQLTADGVFVGSGIFKSSDPARTSHWIPLILRLSKDCIPGLDVRSMSEEQRLALRSIGLVRCRLAAPRLVRPYPTRAQSGPQRP